MPIECPNCGSRNLRYSRFRDFTERLWVWLGVRPLRCRDCRFRFIDRTWRLEHWRYARCPHCWRMDLALWNEKDAHISAFAAFRLSIGGKPYRCEYCRINFVSFRRRHERFTFKRWAKNKKPADPA